MCQGFAHLNLFKLRVVSQISYWREQQTHLGDRLKPVMLDLGPVSLRWMWGEAEDLHFQSVPR